jgi:hypothetical protein
LNFRALFFVPLSSFTRYLKFFETVFISLYLIFNCFKCHSMKKISLLLALFPMFFYGQSITFSTVGSTNYVFPAGITPITVQAWGGGGGGGGSTVPGLNVERAGAGGGGGAFASQTFTIPSGATLSVVVGAGGSGVISGNGTNGSFSTITGYTGSIYAVGGAGGTANTAGGNPAGGAGGTALASTGATKFDGVKGVDGQTGLLITSGAGGQGGNGGGAGGVGVATLLGSTTGNAGAVPGGGGSGSISPLVLGSNRGGGAGGSGRVIISYTCPTYSLTSTAGSIVNLCSGTSSIITLTGNLPVGLYKVSYQVGGVAQTAVNMSVTTTGTGSFIAPGFTTLGNKTVTITNLTSGSSATSSENCSSTISSGNTAVITTTSSGTAPVAVAASGATCTQSTLNWLAVPGATSYEFDLSTDINFGTFLFNAYNTGAALGAIITGLSTNTTYYYRVRSYTSPCVSVNSNTITFKTPIVPSAVTAAAATNIVCSVFNANWNAEVNSTSYLLDVSTSSLFGSFVTGFNGLDVGNVTTYTVTGLTAGTTYYYRVRGKNGCGTGTSSTTQTVATVNTMPGTVTATAATNAICKVFNANWNAGSLATSYLLDVATTSAFTAGTFVGSFNGFDVGNVTTYSVPVPTSGGTYYYRIKGKNGCGNSASFSNVITVTTSSAIPVAPTGVVSSNIWCTQFTMSWNSTVNALAYDVQISTSATFPATSTTQTYTDITTTNHTFTGLTAGTNYYYKVLAKNGCGSSAYGVPSPAFITTTAIPVTPTISPSGSINFCQTSSLVLTSSANTNNVWSTGETTKTITVTSAGSYTVKVVNTGGCDSALSLPTTVTVDGLPTASTAGGSQTICANGSAIISGASATNGSILWTINGGSGTLTNATTLTPTYTPSLGGPARAIVLTMTVTSNNTCTPQTAMDTYTVNIQAAPTAVSLGSQIICPNGSTTVSGATATNGSILWTHNGSGSLTNQTTETPTYTAVPADTGNVVTLTMTVTATPACAIPYTATATYPITVNAINTVSSAAVPPSFCINTPMSNITRTTTGATGISNDGIAGANGLPTGVSATWASNTITISGTPTASGTFNYSIPLTGGCGTVNATGSFIVNSTPQGSLTANGPFCTSGTGQLTFTASAGTGPYTIVYNDGTADRTATNITSGTAFAPFTSIVNSTTTYTLVSVTGSTCVRNSGFTGSSATITVNSVPQGSLTANGPFCSSGTGQLTFTASAGTGPYTIIYNDGTADRTATNITSGTAFAPFTSTVNSTTTYTLVSVTGATCVRNTGFTGSSATITVNSVPQGSLTANGPFCTSGTGQLTFTATAGTGPYTIVYNDGTADRTATNITSGTAFAPFTPSVSNTTTYTLVSVTGATCVRNTGFTGSSATITVNSVPQGSLTANGPFCTSGTGQLTFTASAGTGPYTIVYNDGTADRTATNITSGTAFATFTTPVTSTTTYTLVSVTGATCVRNTGFIGSSATITVNSVPQGSLTANGPFCTSGTGQLTFTASAGTGPYTIIYNDGTADRTATNITSGTAFAPFTSTVNSTTTYTLVSVTGATCVRNTGFAGSSATITVNSIPQGSLTSNGPFCTSGTGQLTFTASAGTGPYTIVYNDGTADRTATNITSGTAFAPFTSTVNSTTTYTLVSVTGSTCVRNTGFTGSSATITVNSVPQGSLTANGPFCATGSGQLTFTVTAGTGPYIVIYSDGTANRTANNVTSGTAFATFTTPVTSTTTYTLVSVTGANSCLRSTGFTGGSATITVNPIPVPTFSDQPGATVCVNTNVTYTTLSGQTNYIWTVPGVANTDYTIISGGISSTDNTVTLQWLTAGNKTVTTSYSSTGCAAVTNASNTTAVTKTDRGAVNGGLHICSGDPSPLLTLHNYVGTIVRWEYAEAIPYVWQPINNTTDTYQPGILTTSTSYRAVVKSGTCPEEFAIETRIDVDTKPSTPVTGTIIQPTCINPTGSIALSGLLAAANWTITQSGTVYQTYSSTGTNFTIPNLVPGNYTFTIHENSSCPSLPTVSIEIKAAITNAWNGTTWSKGSPPINTDVIEFSGNYQTTGDLSGCSCIVDPGVNVTVNSGHTLTITNSVSNNGGILTFENNASLLQINDAINTGNIIYKRNTTAVRRYDFTHWSSPVTRTPDYTLHDLSPLTLGDKYYKYDQSNGWVIIYNGSAPMEKGIGYIVRAPQNYDIDVASVFNAVFTGVPNNGPVAVNLVGAEKWSLIGNPYPSAVYADQFIFDNSANLYGTLYFWTHNTKPSKAIPGDAVYNYTNDDYAIYNLTGSTNIGGLVGTGATTPGNQTAPSGYIAAGVSFFAKSKTGLNAIFTNSMRVPGHNSQFYKSDNVVKTNIERHRLWLNLTNTGGAFKQLLIGYVENATNSWDNNYDAVTLDGNKYLDFYSINEDRKLVIQARALPFVESDSIPLGYRSTIAGDFTIAIDHADGNLTNQPIYIKDKVTGELHDLRAGNYTFTTATGTFLDRFVLRYTNKTLGVKDVENLGNTIFTSVKDKIIKLTSTKEAIAQVEIYDASGKLLYDKKKIGTTDLQIQNLQSGNQVLFIKVTLENGNITTRKIIF